MPARPKPVPVVVSLPALESAEDVRRLNAKQLNIALKQHGQCPKGKRQHKVSVLCSALGFSTSPGSFQTILSSVRSTTQGWTKDIRKSPCISLLDVTDYLLRAHDTITHTQSGDIEEFNSKNLRRYNLYKSKHVHSMLYLPMTDAPYCAIQARCNPSWDTSGTMYIFFCMCLFEEESGKPIGSSCTCVAGQGEACTHVAAMLFALEDFSSLGYQDLPDDPASTELLCAWNAPKNPKVDPVPLKELNYQNHAPGQTESKRPPKRLAEYNPVAPHKRRVNPDSYRRLIHELSLCQPDAPFLTIADAPRWDTSPVLQPSTVVIPTLPLAISDQDPLLIPAAEESVVTSQPDPPTLTSCIKHFMSSHQHRAVTENLVQEFYATMNITKSDQCTINQLTLGQSNNPKWTAYRQGMVTSTSIHPVYTRMQSIKRNSALNANRLVRLCTEVSTFKGNKDTRYGLKYEKVAANAYRQEMKLAHSNFKLRDCGLMVSKTHRFLGASIDCIASCDCHPERPFEIKCLSSMESKPAGSLSELPFLIASATDRSLQLKNRPTPHPYYTQVQCHMAVMGAVTSEFVVWSPQEMAVVSVNFDAGYWASVLANAAYFVKAFLIPHMLAAVSTNHGASAVSVTQVARDDFLKHYVCGNTKCKGLIPDASVNQDNQEARVMCECNCGCRVLYHWRCSNFNSIELEEGEELPGWYCPKCVRACDICY